MKAKSPLYQAGGQYTFFDIQVANSFTDSYIIMNNKVKELCV